MAGRPRRREVPAARPRTATDVAESIIFGVGIFLAFYFILLRPVLQQQRRRKRDISALAIGDEVLTTGGFYATVRDIRTHESAPLEIALEAAPGVMLRGTADAVQQVTRRASEAARVEPAAGGQAG